MIMIFTLYLSSKEPFSSFISFALKMSVPLELGREGVIKLFFRRANRGRVNCLALRLYFDGKKRCLNKLNLEKLNFGKYKSFSVPNRPA